jgi:hypothetical protein
VSRKFLFSSALFGLTVAAPFAFAQETTTTTTTTTTTVDTTSATRDEGAHGLFFLNGGGWNNLTDLDNAGTARFKTGYNVGGGLGVQFTDWAALRGVYSFSRTEGRNAALAPINGQRFDRHYYGADLQFRAPMTSGFSPYLFVGGGAVTINPSADVLFSPTGARFNGDTFTKGAGRFGVGFEYQVPNSGFGLFAQGDGWIYKWDRYGFNRTQVDTNWGAGLSYRFGY